MVYGSNGTEWIFADVCRFRGPCRDREITSEVGPETSVGPPYYIEENNSPVLVAMVFSFGFQVRLINHS
jgi:hypothetical protein